MANYLEKKDFNDEMLVCIAQGKLTTRSIEMFTLLAQNVSTKYNYRYPQDQEDAISSAQHDFCSYWGGYKYKPVYNIVLVRNFLDGERIVIRIPNNNNAKKEFYEYEYVARKHPVHKNDFEIGTTENKSIENLSRLINSLPSISIYSTIHKVTRKITFIDKVNDVGVYGEIEIHHQIGNQLMKAKNFDSTVNIIRDNFGEPSSAFNWATSVAINGIIKSMDKIRPKDWRGGNLITFSELVNEDGEMFGI
jgi:hypothetical protein